MGEIRKELTDELFEYLGRLFLTKLHCIPQGRVTPVVCGFRVGFVTGRKREEELKMTAD